MYSELIYTRCREGIDILKGRSPVRNSGFKVFSCSENITEAGFVDLPLLNALAQSKESYSDPDFMTDAYLYVVPDIGQKYLVNFHPIPFDRSATGDYSHRPGNFINQLFIGAFDDFYPYELFGNESVWDAKKRGESYYYENAPVPLPQRSDIGEEIGSVCFEDIAAFVADGRRDVLMSAIAFVISQYSLPPEDRKFLVIRDEDARKVELWVAAIESAFSPRMSSGLSFATRLDKFVNANKYTVNLDGQYQTQINLQSPNQKLRFRAMIVGVDEHDRANTASIKALPNSPYVVLDGKGRTLSVSIDASNPYYRHVTQYDDKHRFLCREFLQMVDVFSPSGDVLKLYDAYASLLKYESGRQSKDLLSALKTLGQFKLLKAPVLKNIYGRIKQDLPWLLGQDAIAGFSVMDWLGRVASIVGDDAAKDGFRQDICRTYAEKAFTHPRDNTSKALHSAVLQSPFAQDAAGHLLASATVDAYMDQLRAYESGDWAALTEFIIDALKKNRGGFPETIGRLLPEGVRAMYRAGDKKGALQIASSYSGISPDKTIGILLQSASASTDQGYADFLIRLVCRVDSNALSSEASLARLYQQLDRFALGRHFSTILAIKAKSLERPQEMDRFLDWMLSGRDFKGVDLTYAIIALDKNIDISDRTAGRLAVRLQENRPSNCNCINSAHIYALDALDDKRLARGLLPLLDDMIAQGFPSLEDDAYAKRLAGKLFGPDLPDGAFALVVEAASRSAFYSGIIVEEAMRHIGTKQDPVIGKLLEVAASADSEALTDALIRACADLRQFDKGMSAIRASIRSRAVQQYFEAIESDARALREQKKGSSFFGRLFSWGSSGDSDSGRRGRK